MSSLKGEFGGYGLPSNPSDGVRTRRLQAAPTTGSLPRLVNPSAFRDAQPIRAERQRQQQQSKIPSRLPQSPPKTSPGPSASSSRPRHILEPRTVSIPTVGASKSHTQNSSGSSLSALSNESSVNGSDDRLGKRTASSPRNASGHKFDSEKRLSMSPGRQSMASLDEAMNIYMDNSSHVNTSGNIWQQPSSVGATAETTIYPELDRYRNHEHPALEPARYGTDGLYKLSTQNLPSLTPPNNFFSGSSSQLSAASASPSTKFSESPGPGPYSRDTTPTSISSQSPGIVVPIRASNVSKTSQLSPAKSRPPVTRRRAGSLSNDAESAYLDPQGLAAVRESLTSSSSNSTVRDGDRAASSRKKPTKLPPPPPSPPPRKSSQKFRRHTEKEKTPEVPPSKSTTSVKDEAAPSAEFKTGSPRPTRPSRHGTPDLKSQLFDPVPVIQSNLRTRPTTGVRRGSDSSLSSPPLLTTKSKKSASTSNLPVGVRADQDLRARNSEDSRIQPAQSQPSAKPSSASTRFTLFGKKKSTVVHEEKKEGRKLVRKGPAAGTGHEGYGRLGSVRRRSGNQNLTFNYSGPQQSQESVTSEDSFLAERMNPVVIVGGSLDLSRTTSNVSQPTPRSSTDSHSASEQDSSVTADNSSQFLEPSPMPQSLGLSQFPLPPQGSDSDEVAAPNLALRRSMQRLKTAPDSPLRLPQPINTIQIAPSPLTSLDTSVTSGDSHWDSALRTSEDLRNAHPVPRKLKKRAKSPRKWNLFGRSQNTESKKSSPAVSATVTAVEKRPVPFYAMIDTAEQEQDEDLDVQAVLRHAGLYSNSPPKLSLDTNIGNVSSHNVQSGPVAQDRPADQVSRKPSRLQQVGRIPQVVSRRNEKPSPRSFSRPFRASLQRPVSITGFYDPESIAKGPSPPRSSTPLPDLVLEGSTLETSTVPSTNRGSLYDEAGDDQQYGKEFLSFSPRKYSTGTTGTR